MEMSLRGVKNALIDTKNSTYYNVYLDVNSLEVWANDYTSNTDYTQYEDRNVKIIASGTGKYHPKGFGGLTADELHKYVKVALLK